MFNGLLISIEGVDTSGKSTQARRLEATLAKKGYKVKVIHFPNYSTPIGSFIKEIITTDKFKTIDKRALQYLYIADQVNHVEQIKALMDKGYIVILDRYDLSSIVYAVSTLDTESFSSTCYEDSYENKIARRIYDAQSFLIKPDITFVLNMDKCEIRKRKKILDEIESNDKITEKISNTYRNINNMLNDNRKFCFIDAAKNVEAVSDEIYGFLKSVNFEDYLYTEYTN